MTFFCSIYFCQSSCRVIVSQWSGGWLYQLKCCLQRQTAAKKHYLTRQNAAQPKLAIRPGPHSKMLFLLHSLSLFLHVYQHVNACHMSTSHQDSFYRLFDCHALYRVGNGKSIHCWSMYTQSDQADSIRTNWTKPWCVKYGIIPALVSIWKKKYKALHHRCHSLSATTSVLNLHDHKSPAAALTTPEWTCWPKLVIGPHCSIWVASVGQEWLCHQLHRQLKIIRVGAKGHAAIKLSSAIYSIYSL